MALSTAGGMRAVLEDVTVVEPTRPAFFAWVTGTEFESFLRTLDRAERVRTVRCLEDDGPSRLYRIEADRDPCLYRGYAEREAAFVAGSISPEGWRYRLRFPDRDALVSFRQFCLNSGIEFSLRRLTEGRTDAVATDLTDPQREVLEAALESGYFRVPRETPLSGVAERIGISEQAASERLRRAEATAAERLLDGIGGNRKRGP